MTASDDNFARIAEALDRIAGSLEHLEDLATASQPAPRLKIRRQSGDRSPSPAVNLSSDGRLSVNLANEGTVAARLYPPTVAFDTVRELGSVIGRNGLPEESGEVDPAGSAVLVFELNRASGMLFADSPLTIEVPHSPGRFSPFVTVLQVRMAPTGLKDGRHGWHLVSSQIVPGADAAI
jgi:hypothetical protein